MNGNRLKKKVTIWLRKWEKMREVRFQMLIFVAGMFIGLLLARFLLDSEYQQLHIERKIIEQKKYCPYCGELLK